MKPNLRVENFFIRSFSLGAYNPRNTMKFVHVDTNEAIQIHEDLNSTLSFGIHWATFKLTLESYMEPKESILQATESQPHLKPFSVPNIGETVE